MDRLIEFGMGMAMSQQIAQSMNNMMASMRVLPQVQVASQPLYTQNAVQQGSPMQPVYQQYANAQKQGWQIERQQVSQNSASFSQAANQNNSVQVPPPVPQTKKEEQKAIEFFPEIFYFSVDDGNGNKKTEGPFSRTEAARFIINKRLTAKTPVWKSGESGWKNAGDFPELVTLIALVPPQTSAE